MPDSSSPLPTMVRHYAAYLQAKARITPEIGVNGASATIRVSSGEKTLVLIFGCRKQQWSLHSADIRHGTQAISYTRGELVKAVAALLGHEPAAQSPPGICRAS